MAEFVWLRNGDVLPAVSVAQLLLNRTGASLSVDGIFGSHTAAAVRDFQRPRALSPDGVIGQNTWPRLVAHERLQIIDCVDIFDPDLLTSEVAHLRRTGGNPLLIGGMSNGIEQIVTDILRVANNVFLLRFHGHGNRGLAGASAGTGELGDHRSMFRNNAATRAALARLRGCFGPYGCIQFMHCNVASGQQGSSFLRMVADQTSVPASAAVLTQYGSTLRETVRFEGPTRTACPGGQSLRDWSRARPQFVGMSVA